MAFPERNWGIDIGGQSAPDGSVTGLTVLGDGMENYPEISRCISSHLPGVSLGPSESGAGGEIRMSFGFELFERGMRVR
jgi:hypothetical protein